MNESSMLQTKAFPDSEKRAYAEALLRTLSYSKVSFLRYMAVDPYNSIRCKAVSIDHLKRSGTLEFQAVIATVCFGGLPSFADAAVPASGLTAEQTLILKPDLSSLRILPYSQKSACVMCNLYDRTTGAVSDLCCRGLLQRVVEEAYSSGIAFGIGAELEFCLFDAKTNQSVDSTNFASSITLNRQEDFISDLYDQLCQQEIQVEQVHAESAPGQIEVVIHYSNDPVRLADNVVMTRETVINAAHAHGLKAVFLPKVFPSAAGNGSHLHISLRDPQTGQNLFSDKSSLDGELDCQQGSFWAGSSTDISATGRSFLEGILQHLPGLLALTMPTPNSFRRVNPGCWTGSEVCWAFEDKESPLRVVAGMRTQTWERLEYKLCDSTANIYLAIAGILSAGLDGMHRKCDLRPSRHDAGEQTTPLPSTFDDSLECLETDELLTSRMRPLLSKAYLAVRRAEVARHRSSNMSLDAEVKEALDFSEELAQRHALERILCRHGKIEGKEDARR